MNPFRQDATAFFLRQNFKHFFEKSVYTCEPLKHKMMKTPKFILLTLLSVSLVFLSGCKDDPEEEASSYVGNYTLVNATISESIPLMTNEIGEINIPVGIDITTMMQAALLGSVECDPASSLIELREDFSLYLSCSTSMVEINGGTWEEQSGSVIVLNLNSTAVPSSPTGVVLTVTDVSLIGVLLSGTTSVPVAKEMLAGIVQAMTQGNATLDMEATPDAVPMTFTIELQKQ